MFRFVLGLIAGLISGGGTYILSGQTVVSLVVATLAMVLTWCGVLTFILEELGGL